jgi:Mg2+-importing ATPase
LGESQSLFQSGWFVEGLLSPTLIVHMIRTEKIPFFQSTVAPPVVLLTTAIVAVGSSRSADHVIAIFPAR